MIIKCQVSVSSLLLNIPRVLKAMAQSTIKQSKDLCGGEREGLVPTSTLLKKRPDATQVK